MNFVSKFVAVAALLACLGPLPVPGQSAASQIEAEIQRLRRTLQDGADASKDFGDLNSSIKNSLDVATRAVQQHHLYFALEKVGEANDLLEGLQSAKNKAAVVKGGLPVFESDWGKASLELTALDKEAHQRDWTGIPAGVRALSEAAQARAIPLLDGGRGFATSTKPEDGLFYVGQAKGEADFAKFCATLKLRSDATPLRLRSYLPELQSLQRKSNDAFRPPRSIDLHSRFIALNSTLKLASELDASRFYAGALYEYLDAVRHFGMLDAAVPGPKARVELKQELGARYRSLAASKSDESIAQTFLERAQSQLEHPDGSAPSDDEWRSARVILNDVLPAYLAAQKPASPLQAPSGKTVDLTLVRWPYT